MTKRLLMVAFHYPPASGTSGVQRALRFSAHLPEFGWQPIVLSANPRAFDRVSSDLLDDVPADAEVIRAPAWDTKRHLSLLGRYPLFLALPDRWSSWMVGAIPCGLRALRRFRPDAIWSTYPIATAHRIGTRLARSSGLPYVADFRDPMAQEDYPEEPLVWRSFERTERCAVAAASFSTFTTPGAVELYRERYPALAGRMRLLENGYDEATFRGVTPAGRPLVPGKRTLLHSGIVYPSERDPNSLFEAVRKLREREPELSRQLVLRFRAPVHDEFLVETARKHGVEDVVEIHPAVAYSDAIREMLSADGLLLIQSYNCNAQIPAKYYEYLRARVPIVVVTDPAGDTAGAARAAGVTGIGRFEEPDSIARVLEEFLRGNVESMQAAEAAVTGASRASRTAQLAELLDELVHNNE